LESIPAQPTRRAVVLVAAERQAHAIRRYLCVDRQRPQALAGVLFLRPPELAREVLLRAGRARVHGWNEVRRLHIFQLFESVALREELRYFAAEQLRSGRGYAEAFARTIADLEASGLDPELATAVAERLAEHDRRSADRLHDVAVTWKAADAPRSLLATTAQLLAEATDFVRADPELLAPFGPVFAFLTAAPSTTLLRFLRVLPGCRAVFQEACPLRTGTQRWRELMGLKTAASTDEEHRHPGEARGDSPPPAGPPLQLTLPLTPAARPDSDAAPLSELRLVQRYLFERPEVLTDPERPRSHGPDGSFDVEEYPSIEDEIEAAAVWVSEQIAAGTPLEQIALVVPDVDPYASLLADRLARMLDGGEHVPVFIAGGLSLAASPAGARVLALLTAVARGLEAEPTIRLLPALRRNDQDDDDARARLSPSRAAEIVYGAGIVGGSAGDPVGMTEWVERLTRRRDALRRQLMAADQVASSGAEESSPPIAARERQQAERWLHDVEPILPCIAELQQLADAVRTGATLAAVWPAFQDFCQRRLRVPPDPPNLFALLDQRLQPILADAVVQSVSGFSAVHFLIDGLHRERHMIGRFGEPRVFIGTASQASGLSFTAVRILGLAEGALPHSPHDDPIVPDGLRRRIEEIAGHLQRDADVVIPRQADHVLDEIHDVFRVISGAQRRLALSTPRQWVDRSEREVSGIMLEAATALGRTTEHPLATEASSTEHSLDRHSLEGGDVPTAARLRTVYFNAGREARLRHAAAEPLSPRAVLTTVGHGAPGIAVPASWTHGGALSVDTICRLVTTSEPGLPNGVEGTLAAPWSQSVPPGLEPEHPISASALTLLLGCPFRFLLERILHLAKPTSRPSTDVLDAAVYGSLFHTAAERFYHEAGAAVCGRADNLESWVARAQDIAAAAFEELREQYPLRGADGIARERGRLLRQIEQLVIYEWRGPRREFLESELTFGEPAAVPLHVPSGAVLYVRGKIDRIDRIEHGLAVRDLKTGRVRDFGEEPINAARDLQIGLYVLALESSGYGGMPVSHAAYVHPSAAQEPDRAFTGAPLDLLRQQTREWLGIARQLLTGGLFPRTPNTEDCAYCPFVPACGEGAQRRSAAAFGRLPPAHVLEPFVRFKQRRVEEDT
jgi:hypothetical protein